MSAVFSLPNVSCEKRITGYGAQRPPRARGEKAADPCEHKSTMKLVMTLLVRDESDIIEKNIEFHRSMGVDHFIITDNCSVDGTREILSRYVDAGIAEVFHEPALDYEQGRWVTRMAQMASTKYNADWVINADADEFFWPIDGVSIKDALAKIPRSFSMVEVYPVNMIPPPGKWDAPWHQAYTYIDAMSSKPLSRKVVHRGSAHVVVWQGNHGVDGDGFTDFAPDQPLKIFHFPDRGYAHYRRKIENGGRAYAANTRLPVEFGHHWREHFEMLQAGTLEATYQLRRMTEAQFAARVKAGAVYQVSTLNHYLAELDARSKSWWSRKFRKLFKVALRR